MNKVQLRDAKAGLSKLVAAAERGEPTTITRHGKAVAVLVSVEDAGKLEAERQPSFLEFLKTIPVDIEELLGEDRLKIRDVDL